MQGLISNWACIKENKWSIPNLRKYYGNKVFECNHKENMTMTNYLILSSAEESEASFQHYSDLVSLINGFRSIPTEIKDSKVALSYHQNPIYIFDPTFEVDNNQILSDYQVPSLFHNIDNLIDEIPYNLMSRPNFRWFLVGCQYSGSEFHVDPLGSSAWNALVVGKKLWIMIEPSLGSKLIFIIICYYNTHENSYVYVRFIK